MPWRPSASASGGGARLHAVPAAPAHVGLRAELGGQVEVAHDLGQREPAHVTVVGGEPPVLEHRVAEQVGGRRRHDQPGLVQRLAERGDPLVPLGLAGPELEHVVVVEVHAVGAELGQLVHGPLGGHGRPGGAAEHIHALPPDSPDTEREPVLIARHVTVSGHGSVPFLPRLLGLQSPKLSAKFRRIEGSQATYGGRRQRIKCCSSPWETSRDARRRLSRRASWLACFLA